MAVNQLFSKLVDGIYPPTCVLCGESGQNHPAKDSSGLDLCSPCQGDLPSNQNYCFQCAIPLPLAATNPQSRCGDCLKSAPKFTHSCVPYLYQWPLDRLIQRFKFQGNLAAGRVLARLLSQAVAADPETKPVAIVPVPLHPSRLRERGFNQATLLAADIAKDFQIPLLGNALLRHTANQPQADLDAHHRQKNIRGVFSIKENILLPDSVALVDDVMTTGSTLAEAAKVLLVAGVKRVDCWVVARTP